MSLQQYLKVVICSSILTDLTKFLLSFCGWSVRRTRSYRCEKNKERQEFKLGDVQGTPSKYSKDTQASKYEMSLHQFICLGMSRLASHLSSSTIIFIPRFLFCSHDLCPLCFSFYLRAMLVWDVPSSIYIMIHVLHLYLLSMTL